MTAVKNTEPKAKTVYGVTVMRDNWGTGIFPLTPCCGAVATGTEDGTACRVCYELVSDWYGDYANSPEDLYRIVSGIKNRNYPANSGIHKRMKDTYEYLCG